MTPNTPQLQRNVPFRTFSQQKGSPFLSLRAIPFLIVLASSLAIQAAVGASPVVTTIPVTAPNGVVGIVADPIRSRVYVADSNNVRVAVIDTITNQISSFIHTSNPPVGLGISPDGNTLYVTENDFLEAISLTTFTQIFLVPVGIEPFIPGVASNGSSVYVPNLFSGNVTPVGGPLGITIPVGGAPLQVVFNHNNTSAYVTIETPNIPVINTATGSLHAVFTSTDTFGLARKGNTLFATGINNVFVINTNTNTVVHTINVPGSAALFLPALTPDGAFLYAPTFESNTGVGKVVVINTITNKVVQTFTVGQGPFQVATAANDIYGYVTNRFDGTVTVFQLAHLPPGL